MGLVLGGLLGHAIAQLGARRWLGRRLEQPTVDHDLESADALCPVHGILGHWRDMLAAARWFKRGNLCVGGLDYERHGVDRHPGALACHGRGSVASEIPARHQVASPWPLPFAAAPDGAADG